MSRLSLFAFVPVFAAAFAPAALAQETVPPAGPAATQQGVIPYTAADFAASRPNTALDIINRLPGFTLESGDQVRGFAGAAGNVLIDGQRPTTKSDNLQDTLARIPVDQVERIDLIRGGAPGIDMQGKAVVANVIRKKADSFQQVVQAGDNIFAETGHNIWNWSYQATRRAGDHQFDVTLSRGNAYDDSIGFGWRTHFDVASGITTFESSETESDGVPYAARVNYKGPLFGGTFSANGVIGTQEFKDEQRLFNADINERYQSRNYEDRGEIGLNYTRPLTSNLEFEALAIAKENLGNGVANGNQNDATPPATSQLFTFDSESGESIARGVLRYRQSPTLQFEGGGETAFNYLEQKIAFTQDGVPVSLSASNVRVEEVRGEAFLQGTWRPSKALSLEAGVRVEQSTITQSGDQAKERSFTYPKPRLLATWSLTGDDQLRARIERSVGQLNFGDFVSSVNLGTGVNTTGNSDLRPDKTWAYEVAYERRFWGNGALVLTLRHEAITDVVDQLPFLVTVDANSDGVPDDANSDGVPDTIEVSGPGNIGDGTNDVIDLSLTVPLEKIGVKGGEVKVQTSFQNSDVRDPFTGDQRRISGQRPDNINISYRQDLPDLKLTYGVNFFGGWAEQHFLRTEVQDLNLRTFFGAFVEYKPTPRLTLNAQLNNFIPYTFNIERRVYDGRRGSSALDFVEIERRNSQVIVQLRARWAIG